MPGSRRFCETWGVSPAPRNTPKIASSPRFYCPKNHLSALQWCPLKFAGLRRCYEESPVRRAALIHSTCPSRTRPARQLNQRATRSCGTDRARAGALAFSQRSGLLGRRRAGLAALLMHPFATKEYVRRHTEPIRDRLNELDEITASNQKMIRDVDARAQHGLQLASEKVNLADEHATDAANKAQTAQQTAATLNTRVSADETTVRNLDQYKSGAQTELHFRPGQTALSKEAKDALDQVAAQLK